MTRGKYTVNEVEERTKVPASTLRQWERRYGFPKPDRSDAGYRLYSDSDVASIETMKFHIADGVPASKAAELVKRATLEPSGARSLREMRGGLVGAFRAFDEAQANEILSEAYAMHTVEGVLLELFQGVMEDIGALWHRGEVNAAVEHFASSYLQGRLRALLNISKNLRHMPTVIVACAPSERHELGALAAAVLLCRAGYCVCYLGADTPLPDLREAAEALRPVGVLVSATTAPALHRLLEGRGALQAGTLQEAAPVLAFGGRAFDERPEFARALGGVHLSSDLLGAVAHFHTLVGYSIGRATHAERVRA